MLWDYDYAETEIVQLQDQDVIKTIEAWTRPRHIVTIFSECND